MVAIGRPSCPICRYRATELSEWALTDDLLSDWALTGSFTACSRTHDDIAQEVQPRCWKCLCANVCRVVSTRHPLEIELLSLMQVSNMVVSRQRHVLGPVTDYRILDETHGAFIIAICIEWARCDRYRFDVHKVLVIAIEAALQSQIFCLYR